MFGSFQHTPSSVQRRNFNIKGPGLNAVDWNGEGLDCRSCRPPPINRDVDVHRLNKVTRVLDAEIDCLDGSWNRCNTVFVCTQLYIVNLRYVGDNVSIQFNNSARLVDHRDCEVCHVKLVSTRLNGWDDVDSDRGFVSCRDGNA